MQLLFYESVSQEVLAAPQHIDELWGKSLLKKSEKSDVL